jgi:hypothetical protein
MRRTANGRSVKVLQGSSGQPHPVSSPVPPQVPQRRTQAPPVQQSFRFRAQ